MTWKPQEELNSYKNHSDLGGYLQARCSKWLRSAANLIFSLWYHEKIIWSKLPKNSNNKNGYCFKLLNLSQLIMAAAESMFSEPELNPLTSPSVPFASSPSMMNSLARPLNASRGTVLAFSLSYSCVHCPGLTVFFLDS